MRRRPDAGAYAQLALYRQLAAAAVRGTELITEALVTQTDPAREPSPADILAAIVSVGQSFHDLHLAIADVGKQVADLREERRRDWEQVHAQIAAERRRQIEAEGYSPDHDDDHTAGELAQMRAIDQRHQFGGRDDGNGAHARPALACERHTAGLAPGRRRAVLGSRSSARRRHRTLG